jgi:hypothetical protein
VLLSIFRLKAEATDLPPEDGSHMIFFAARQPVNWPAVHAISRFFRTAGGDPR